MSRRFFLKGEKKTFGHRKRYRQFSIRHTQIIHKQLKALLTHHERFDKAPFTPRGGADNLKNGFSTRFYPVRIVFGYSRENAIQKTIEMFYE